MFAYCGNNPVNRVDVGGRAYAHIGTKEERIILTGGGSVPVGGGVVLPVDPLLIDALFDSVEDAAKKIIAWVETQTGKEEFDNNSVYILVDPNDGNLTKYVGRTVNPIRRAYEHKNDPLHYWRKDYEMIVVATSLSKEDSILFEQALISAYTLAYLENARREIAKKNISKFTSYVGAVAEIITDVPANDILKLITER